MYPRFFCAIWDFHSDAGTIQKFAFLTDNQTLLFIVNVGIYVIFGILLAVLVLALHQRIKGDALALTQLAAVFGIVWIGLIIASGMIANIGLAAVIELYVKDPDQAMTLWLAINAVVEGLGGGNEVVGGLWVLLLSIAALKSNAFPKILNYLGLFIGCTGMLTIYPADIWAEIFGLGQILWFTWLVIIFAGEVTK